MLRCEHFNERTAFVRLGLYSNNYVILDLSEIVIFKKRNNATINVKEFTQ